MKLFFLLLLTLLTGMGTFCWRAPQPKVSATNVALLPVATPTAGVLLGVGTVVSSYSFPLARPRRGPIRHLYVADGQYVRKGELLLKFYDHTFLLAPMAGIITQFSRTALDERSAAAPDYFFTARTPFRLQLSDPVKATLLAGQRVQVQSTHDPAQVVTGELLTSSTTNSSSQFIDLRLLTVGHEPLRAGSQVRISALPAHT
jgi:hypothetical protein